MIWVAAGMTLLLALFIGSIACSFLYVSRETLRWYRR